MSETSLESTRQYLIIGEYDGLMLWTLKSLVIQSTCYSVNRQGLFPALARLER